MKVRNYERMNGIYWVAAVIVIIELSGIIFLCQKKTFNYQLLSAIVIKKNYVILMVNKEQRKTIYQNKKLFWKNQSKKYEIIEDHGKMLTKNNKNYYELIIKFSFSQEYKANDVLELVFPNKKKRQIEIFKIIWGGA